MPRLRRTSKRHTVTLDVINASLDIESWREHWGGDAEAREAWAALRDSWRQNRGTRPAPFWAYEPGVPAELRALASVNAPEMLVERGRAWLREDFLA